ncbi:MAG: hypothetical protein IJE92_01200 [Clostridia bacterium]|nr:hypothetical protein [Clostridia bacterium]
MAHIHPVTDSDTHFIIDPITRQLKNETCKKLTLMQGDHNSERFTFELPRYIEGHDMSTCNKVEVHYINIDAETKQRGEGVYEVDDFITKVDEGICLCSWLVSGNATKYSGFLNFVVRFTCVNDETVDYVWNTAIYSGITISDGVYNGNAVITEYADILAQWWKKLLLASGGNIDENSGEQIKIWVGTTEEYEALGGEIIENCLYIITDDERTLAEAFDAIDELETQTNEKIETLTEQVDELKEKTDLLGGADWTTTPNHPNYGQGYIIEENGLYQVRLPNHGIFGFFEKEQNVLNDNISLGVKIEATDNNLVIKEYRLVLRDFWQDGSSLGRTVYVQEITTTVAVSDGAMTSSATSTVDIPFYIRRIG